MSDRLFYALAALAAVVLIALAVVWPQRPGGAALAPAGGEVTATGATPAVAPAPETVAETTGTAETAEAAEAQP